MQAYESRVSSLHFNMLPRNLDAHESLSVRSDLGFIWRINCPLPMKLFHLAFAHCHQEVDVRSFCWDEVTTALVWTWTTIFTLRKTSTSSFIMPAKEALWRPAAAPRWWGRHMKQRGVFALPAYWKLSMTSLQGHMGYTHRWCPYFHNLRSSACQGYCAKHRVTPTLLILMGLWSL